MKKLINISNFGISISLVYIGAIVWLRWPFPLSTLKAMPLNELGDFLAGVFGPLTLFWLILGFLLQREELRQNTKALNMQAEELKESVNQYKQMVAISQKQVEAEIDVLKIQKDEIDRKVLPRFVITDIRTEFALKNMEFLFKELNPSQELKFSHHVFSVDILNEGSSVTDYDIQVMKNWKSIETNWPHGAHLDHNQKVTIHWNDKIEEAPDEVDIIIYCFDSLGRSISKRFELALGEGPEYHNFTMPEDKEKVAIVKPNTHSPKSPIEESNILKFKGIAVS